MAARCSLDDFIEHNKDEVRVSPGSNPVEFSGLKYKVPPGALFDLRVLRGEGYQLLSPDMRDGVDISHGFGFALIVDKEGKETGYGLGSHGSQSLDGTKRFNAYFIGDRTPAYRGKDFERKMERYDQAQRKFGDVLWGAGRTKK